MNKGLCKSGRLLCGLDHIAQCVSSAVSHVTYRYSYSCRSLYAVKSNDGICGCAVLCIQVRPCEVISALLASYCVKYRNRISELLWPNQIKWKSNTYVHFCGSGCVIIPTIKRKDEGKVTIVTIYYVNNTTYINQQLLKVKILTKF